MPRPLIIGYGNTLRSDDGVGQHIAGELSGSDEFCGAGIVACPQLLPEYAWLISQAERVLLIDAANDLAPGQTRLQRVTPANPESLATVHEFSPGTLVSLAHNLYGSCPPVDLLTIGGENFELGESVSPRVTECLPAIFEQVKEWLAADGAGKPDPASSLRHP